MKTLILCIGSSILLGSLVACCEAGYALRHPETACGRWDCGEDIRADRAAD